MKISVRNILFNSFAILSLLLSAFVLFLLVSGTHAYAVESGSMEPALHRGDVVFVRSVQPETLQTGDVITAHFPESEGVFTHRIVSVDTAAKQLTTKGDHNMDTDPMPTSWDHVVGKLWFSVPYIGFLSLNLQSGWLPLIVLGAVLVLIAVRFILQHRKKTNG